VIGSALDGQTLTEFLPSVCAVLGGLALADNAPEAMMLGRLKERLAVAEGLDQA